MREVPIMFSPDLVLSILGGWKTITHRAIPERTALAYDVRTAAGRELALANSIYGQAGDTLWVREYFRLARVNGGPVLIQYMADGRWAVAPPGTDPEAVYGAKGERSCCFGGFCLWPGRPGVLMKREFARLFLDHRGARLRSIQTITMDEMKKEGIHKTDIGWTMDGRTAYRTLKECWRATWNGMASAKIEDNPTVYRIEFSVDRARQPKTSLVLADLVRRHR